ncbi:hypothetical protein DSO57_1011708 [Entomophthora muscae]|uniref:Uncharacterized protein n=1 Tax=Entomophthora muscae TaxID=34485 RepID=A0ACC2SIZ8_9FUNG|nr:hypothetical protein DSO57_1011708 [Entomophthora muscae]
MLASLTKFVVFTLAPILVMIWTTIPDLWDLISFSLHHVGDNPDHFLNLFANVPGCSQDLLATSENLDPPESYLPVEMKTTVPEEEKLPPQVRSQAHSLAAWWDPFDGFGLSLTPIVLCVLAVDTSLSGHTSLALNGVLVNSAPGMGAGLS